MEDNLDPEQQALGLMDYLRIIRERIWLMALIVVVVVGAALAVDLNATSKYRATTTLVLQRTNLDQAFLGTQLFAVSNQARDVETGAALVKQRPIAQAVKDALGTSLSTEALLSRLEVKSSSTNNIIEIRATSTDPSEAAAIANAFAEQFVRSRQEADRQAVAAARDLVKQELDNMAPSEAESQYALMLKDKYESLRILESMQTGGFIITQPATPPSSPYSPQPLRDGIVALVVGAILGVGAAFVAERLDRRVKDEDTLRQILGVPVLAVVPLVENKADNESRLKHLSFARFGSKKSLHTLQAPLVVTHPALLEAFRVVRTSLDFLAVGKECKTIVVTSGLPGEGKTFTVCNLALSLAMAGKRVILVEADLRRPKVRDYLRLDGRFGLSNLLALKATLNQALQMVELEALITSRSGKPALSEQEGTRIHKNLWCLAAGPLPPNPAELLGSDVMKRLLEALAENADYVLIDTPPLLLVADALALAPTADGVIIAARLEQSTREEIERIALITHEAGIKVLGAVASGPVHRPGYYSRYGAYGYGYGYGYGSTSTGRAHADTSDPAQTRRHISRIRPDSAIQPSGQTRLDR